jgi:hypothetical protein
MGGLPVGCLVCFERAFDCFQTRRAITWHRIQGRALLSGLTMENTERSGHAYDSQLEKHSLAAVGHDEVTEQWSEKDGVAKGDDSDGRVNWTWRQTLATISLCGVYVGKLDKVSIQARV